MMLIVTKVLNVKNMLRSSQCKDWVKGMLRTGKGFVKNVLRSGKVKISSQVWRRHRHTNIGYIGPPYAYGELGS